MRILLLTLLAALWVGLGRPAVAAEPEAAAGVRREDKFVGEPFGVFVRAEGFEEDPAPACVAPDPAPGVTLRFVKASPQVSSYMQFFNGKRIEERKVTYTYQFEAVASKPGTFSFGPFRVTQGAKEATTEGFLVAVKTMPIDESMSIDLQVPEGPHAPGERVPVTVVWRLEGDLSAARGVSIRSPLFDAFSFDDVNAGQRDLLLPLTTKDGLVRVKATVERESQGTRKGVVVKAVRYWRVDKPGEYDFAPIQLTMQRVTRWQRTFFGDREPAAFDRVRAVGKPLRVVVEPLPETGRPDSFAGAVGRGFSLDVTADRTVLRAGDPIRLTVRLRGAGNLDRAGLPPLTAGGGLDPLDFRQADAEPTGEVADDTKVFEVTVRVEHDRVARVPPIEYAWWNPKLRAYETTQSEPIALQVGEAKVVSAQDVVRGRAANASAPAENDGASRRSASQIASGADLSMVEDVSRLRAHARGSSLPWVCYGLSALALAMAWFLRQRERIDPRDRKRRTASQQACAAIDQAARQPAAQGAREAAAALRALRATFPGAATPPGLDDVLAQMDAIAFRPKGHDDAVPRDLWDRAKAIATELGA